MTVLICYCHALEKGCLFKIHSITAALSRRGIATVGVGFPATNMVEERVRFCVSASHTKEMLDAALAVVEEEAEKSNLPRSTYPVKKRRIEY